MDPSIITAEDQELPWTLEAFLSIPEDELAAVHLKPDWLDEQRNAPMNIEFTKTIRPEVVVRSRRYTDVFAYHKTVLTNQAYV